MREAAGASGKGLHNASLKKHVFRIFNQLHQALWSMPMHLLYYRCNSRSSSGISIVFAATQVAATTLRSQMTAATEHGDAVLCLQSTAMLANVVFINIDWKASRLDENLEANMMLLGRTIARVVRNMKPAMVCMCQVGEASNPFTKEQMQQVADRSMQAWRDAATDVQLHCMFEVGAPYMTIYIDGSVQCSCHRILEGLPRTAQTFLCCGPGGVTVDVINVHAPSGNKKLTDQQRKTLLTNLLQSNSKSMPGRAIGSARFLIGGDMNTAPFLLSQLLQVCRDNGSLRTKEQIHEPVLGNPGGLCVLGGFKADSLATTAENHDSQHKPYGICWSMAHGAATPKIPTKPYEDEEDEDNGFTQSLAVTTQASSSADGGVAQSMTVPQQARSKSENYGVAQSLTVTTQARWSNAAEMDTDMEFLEEMMLETESIRREIQERLEEEIRDRLARRFQLQVWIEHELLRQQWQNEFEHAEEVERVRIVESEFDGLSEEVVDQFLLSDPPLYSRRPSWIEMDSDSDIGQSLTSDEDGSERLGTS